MLVRQIRPEEKEKFNQVVTHPLQSWEWGEFREKTGLKVIRMGLFDQEKLLSGFQLTIHKIPKTSYTIGYLPKCTLPDDYFISSLKKIGQQQNFIFIKLEPNVGTLYIECQTQDKAHQQIEKFLLSRGCTHGRPLFTKYTFQIDLEKSEEALLKSMKSKTRYNVRLAQKHGVKVCQDNSPQTFEKYLQLTFETTKRQKFYAHDREYHRLLWETLSPAGIAHLLKASWQGKILVTWILFVFHDTLYYPYGASSSEHRELMASNLIMWEAIRFGKRMGCKTFDLWGSLGPNPDPADPWRGFHRFKEGYGPQLVEFVGSFDLVINKPLYKLYTIADNLRWKWLKLKAALPF